MKKLGIALFLLFFGINSLFCMERPAKRLETEEKASKNSPNFAIHCKSLKDRCLAQMASNVIQNINIENPLKSKGILEDLKQDLPEELYQELLCYLEHETQPLWTRGAFLREQLALYKICTNDSVAAWFDPYFRSNPAQCHFLPLAQQETTTKDFIFSEDIADIALASKTNYIALANDHELLLWNIQNKKNRFIPIYQQSEKHNDDGLIFNKNEELTTITFSPNGTTLFIGTSQGRCIILNNITEELNYDTPIYRTYFTNQINLLTCTQDGSYLIAINDKNNVITAQKENEFATSKQVPIELPKDKHVFEVIVSPDNSIIACNVGEQECYFYNTRLKKTVCYPELHFFAIDDDNHILTQISMERKNLLCYFIIDFMNESFDCKKTYVLPKNTQLAPTNKQVNPFTIPCLIDTDEDGATTCILKPKTPILELIKEHAEQKATQEPIIMDELLMKLAVEKCMRSPERAKLLDTLLKNNETFLKTFKELFGSSSSNLIMKYIKLSEQPEQQG